MNKELEQLNKAISQATDVLEKSHVKEHTRTSKSGAVSHIQAYDDKRTKAQEKSKFANDTQAKHNWDDPRDTKVVAANHADAGHAHIEALRHATTNEQVNEHHYAASRHFQANDSMHSFHKGNEAHHAEQATNHAHTLSEHAWDESHGDRRSPKEAHDSVTLNKTSALHINAMEQHQRAEGAHMREANTYEYGGEKQKHSMEQAQYHRDEAHKHGKEVQRIAHIAIDASAAARDATTKAANSKKPEDHKAAAEAHRKAAKLDWDSETGPAHTRWAEQHEKLAGKK